MSTTQRYSPEVRERACGWSLSTRQNTSREWAAIVSIADKIGCTPESLRQWVRQAEREGGQARRTDKFRT